MAVVSVHEISDGREGDAKIDKLKSIRNYTRVFRVVTNSPSDEVVIVEIAMAAAYGISPGAVYPRDFGSWCQSLKCKNDPKTKIVWTCTATYTSQWPLDPNPLNDPAQIEWDGDTFQRPFFKDNAGHAILTSAGNYFKTPVEGDDSRWTVSIKKNLAVVPTWLLGYKDSVNSDPFVLDGVSIAVRQAKMMPPKIGVQQNRNSIYYRPVTLVMHLNPDTWDKVLLDEDTMQSVTLFGVSALMPCYDTAHQPVREPVPLDGSGGQLANPTPSTCHYITAKIYKELPFASLPLT